MPFITLKAQKVKRMQAYLSFRGTASKSVLDIAWVAAIAPVTVSVGREHLPAVQASAFVERLRALPNRLRVFRPPFPAARIRAEFSLASTAGLYQLRAAAQAGFRRFGSRPGAYPGQFVRDTVISNRIAADSHLYRNRPITQIPASKRLNLLALPKRDRHRQPSSTFPTEATVFRSVRRRMFPCSRPLAGQALK